MSGLPPVGPLAYGGTIATPYITRSYSPTTSDFTFNIPTIWINSSSKEAFILVAKPIVMDMNIALWLKFAPSGGGGETTWNTVTGTSITPVASNGYVLTSGSTVTVTLPENITSNLYDTFTILGLSGGFTFQQADNQQIQIGTQQSTLGATGSISTSSSTYSSITLILASIAGGVYLWDTLPSPQGNFLIM